jgi:hypothetical protein
MNDSPELTARQGKYKHEFGLEAYAELERYFTRELDHCYNTMRILCPSAALYFIR